MLRHLVVVIVAVLESIDLHLRWGGISAAISAPSLVALTHPTEAQVPVPDGVWRFLVAVARLRGDRLLEFDSVWKVLMASIGVDWRRRVQTIKILKKKIYRNEKCCFLFLLPPPRHIELGGWRRASTGRRGGGGGGEREREMREEARGGGGGGGWNK